MDWRFQPESSVHALHKCATWGKSERETERERERETTVISIPQYSSDLETHNLERTNTHEQPFVQYAQKINKKYWYRRVPMMTH